MGLPLETISILLRVFMSILLSFGIPLFPPPSLCFKRGEPKKRHMRNTRKSTVLIPHSDQTKKAEPQEYFPFGSSAIFSKDPPLSVPSLQRLWLYRIISFLKN
jgi:hypothetical protein